MIYFTAHLNLYPALAFTPLRPKSFGGSDNRTHSDESQKEGKCRMGSHELKQRHDLAPPNYAAQETGLCDRTLQGIGSNEKHHPRPDASNAYIPS